MLEQEKQKALELIKKFYEQTASDNRSYSWETAVIKGGKSFERARQCALICWDEILKSKYEDSEYMEAEKRMWHDRIRKAIETINPSHV